MARLLIADSHRDCRETLAELLKLDGHSVVLAASMAELLAHPELDKLDLLIADSRLSGSSLLALCQLGRRYAGRVAVTTTHLSEQESRQLDDSSVSVLRKPLFHAELQQIIDSRWVRLLTSCATAGEPVQVILRRAKAPAARAARRDQGAGSARQLRPPSSDRLPRMRSRPSPLVFIRSPR